MGGSLDVEKDKDFYKAMDIANDITKYGEEIVELHKKNWKKKEEYNFFIKKAKK